MTLHDLQALLPLEVLAAAALLALVGIGIRRSEAATVALTFLGLAGSLAVIPVAAQGSSPAIGFLLLADPFGLFFMGLFSGASLILVAISTRSSGPQGPWREEFYVLLLLATLGAGVIAESRHFASFFLGLELLGLSLYGLIAYPRGRRRSLEAALKYLILNSTASAFLLFGMALVYASSGTMDIQEPALVYRFSGWSAAGFCLMAIGIGYKLALVPFHMWSPDVYQGAPILVSAFLSTVSKGAVWAFLLRFFQTPEAAGNEALSNIVQVVAIVSMTVGNVLALLQRNLRRLLAYSSVAHAGYFLAMLPAGGPGAERAMIYYFVAYLVTNLGAFGIMASVLPQGDPSEDLDDYRGLFRKHPWRAALLTLYLLSLAGLPLTAGFLGKFYIIAAGARSALWAPVFFVIANSVLGLFYYLRAGVALFLPALPDSRTEPIGRWGGALPAFSLLTFLLVILGVYPQPLAQLIDRAIPASMTGAKRISPREDAPFAAGPAVPAPHPETMTISESRPGGVTPIQSAEGQVPVRSLKRSCSGELPDLNSRSMRLLAIASAIGLLASCGRESQDPSDSKEGIMTIKITSTAFGSGKPIPKKHTGEGPDVSPPLAWSGVPSGAKELALICDDPDAPTEQPWVHWVLYTLSPALSGLKEGDSAGGVEGKNDFGKAGYGGPLPPPGHGVHHYHFKLYALDQPLEGGPGLTKDQLLSKMKGHVTAQGELVGTYERK